MNYSGVLIFEKLKMKEEPQKLERKTSHNEIASKRRGSTVTVDTKTPENVLIFLK